MSLAGGYRGGGDMRHEDMSEGDPRLEALFGALDGPDAIDPDVAARHVAAAAAEAMANPLLAPKAEPARWYRRVLVRGASLGLTAKLFLGTAIAVAATGGAAAGGILPDPVQSFIADALSPVGIDLPNPGLATTATTSDTTSTTSNTTETTTSAATSSSVTTAEIDDDEIESASDVTPGAYVWETTTCAADPIRVAYTVTTDGALVLDSVTGTPEIIDADRDRIRVEFADVRIDIESDGEEVTVDEDRECDDTSPTSSPDADPAPTSSAPDDNEPEAGTTTTTATHPHAGSHSWTSTSCEGAPISVAYRVNSDGTLGVVSVAGDVTDIDEGTLRIRVQFDGVEVDIRIDGSSLLVDEDRDCATDN